MAKASDSLVAPPLERRLQDWHEDVDVSHNAETMGEQTGKSSEEHILGKYSAASQPSRAGQQMQFTGEQNALEYAAQLPHVEHIVELGRGGELRRYD